MDNLHTVLRTLQDETKRETKSAPQPKPDHLTVFREFLAHLDDVQRKTFATAPDAKPATKSTRAKAARKKAKKTK